MTQIQSENPDANIPNPRDLRDMDIMVSIRYDLFGRAEYFVTPFKMEDRQTPIEPSEVITTLEMAKTSTMMSWIESRNANA